MTLPNTARVIEHGIIEGLEAREILPFSEYCDPCAFTTAIGNRFRFQLGLTVPHVDQIPVYRNGKITSYDEVPNTVFELIAFGPDRSAAIEMLRRNRPTIGERADLAAKQALATLMR